MRPTAPLVVLLALAAACGGEDAPAVDPDAPTAADTLNMAFQAFDPTAFDTVRWEADSLALERGKFVFDAACASCHGAGGHGDAGFVTEAGDTLHPPDFAREDFPMRGDVPSLRQKVFAGNVAGMPHWGLRRMDPRDIDAVARYVDHLSRMDQE